MNDQCVGNSCEPVAPYPSPGVEMRGFSVEPLNHGFVVRVGCQQFAIEKKEDLVSKLTEYITNPAATEKKWFEGKLF